MANSNTSAPAQEAVLTDDEILGLFRFGESPERIIKNARAIESALLSKLRAPVADERAAFDEWPDIEVVNRIVRSVCETEPADPDRPDSVCINVDELRTIIEAHVTASAPVADERAKWQNAQRIVELPAVDKALANFCDDGTQSNAVLLVLAVLDAAPQASEAVRDAAFEAVRKRLCAIPRYSFYLDDDGVVRRVEGRSGNWIEFDAVHELFDPISVDAALSAQPAGGLTHE